MVLLRQSASPAPEGTPKITHPQRGLAETPELPEKGLEKAIPNIYELESIPVSSPSQTGGVGFLLMIAIALAVGGLWFWKNV